MTGCELSVVPAVTVTGELTVEPLAGEQIVTEGEAGLRVNGAATAEKDARSKKLNNCVIRKKFHVSRWLVRRFINSTSRRVIRMHRASAERSILKRGHFVVKR